MVLLDFITQREPLNTPRAPQTTARVSWPFSVFPPANLEYYSNISSQLGSPARTPANIRHSNLHNRQYAHLNTQSNVDHWSVSIREHISSPPHNDPPWTIQRKHIPRTLLRLLAVPRHTPDHDFRHVTCQPMNFLHHNTDPSVRRVECATGSLGKLSSSRQSESFGPTLPTPGIATPLSAIS